MIKITESFFKEVYFIALKEDRANLYAKGLHDWGRNDYVNYNNDRLERARKVNDHNLVSASGSKFDPEDTKSLEMFADSAASYYFDNYPNDGERIYQEVREAALDYATRLVAQ